MTERDKKASVKFLANEANIDDLAHLNEWLKDSKNNQLFKDYIKSNYLMDSGMNSFNSEIFKKNYLKIIREEKRKERRLKIYRWSGYAAAIVVVALLIGNFVFNGLVGNSKDELVPVVVNNNIKPGENKAVLTLDDGEEIIFTKGASMQTQDAISNGEELVYKPNESTSKKIVFNTLTIPRGGQFFVKLSDGTQVWLNSESQLKYPVNFIEGQTREVELVYGEAYFNVSHSSEHLGSHFKVLNNSQEVEVLGTTFNIKAYKEESIIYTTLVSGKVFLKTNAVQQNLIPGEQIELIKSNGELIKRKVNTSTVISWIDGNFDFNDVPLGEIMKVLSRWYDMDVKFQNESIKYQRFTGRLSKNHTIEDILTSIKGAEIINSYEISNKQLIIK
ncbi:FecR family protein [Aestuariibaculum suncheonense]|uniref:FecR family protein n=1 Tax=Aestuariibaculum suncheonense TaxID=1028745 RepID=A0A8J6UB83_9FLAO|nr:FecR family protein [Aestuariibaculum suncheonense]MBD0836083.1 FecR family protein [Aestuariibaculum suncheonense]